MGAAVMRTTLRQDFKFKVSKHLLNEYFKLTEPEAHKQRRFQRFKRKRFWAAGVMDIIALDQHDKWKRPYAGRIAWLNIWWTNRNVRLICSYYLKSGREIGGIPLVTQSDPGSENYGLANCHTNARHHLDPSLKDTLQHRWMRKHQNIKPEALWSQLRRQWTPGFEDVLDHGLNNGLYNPDDPLENLVFRWLAIPWLQAELDKWRLQYNSSPRRADKNKILPHGIPDLITAKPHLFNSENFKVIVPPALFDELEKKWAPPSDPVFSCTPPEFDKQAQHLYSQILGSPAAAFLTAPFNDDLAHAFSIADDGFLLEIPLMEGLRELRNGGQVIGPDGYQYFGGLENPPGLEQPDTEVAAMLVEEQEEEEEDLRQYAEFSE
ncbi:hypothetical protein C8J57DRAFT_1434292 [Mycena rebaudengoi]|nr:hypothetical protein C8J57DRAFT_1434292 [Mycena rebaudengoi]